MAERSGGGFDARGPAIFGVARAAAVVLAEGLDVGKAYRLAALLLVGGLGRLDPRQMDQAVEQHGRVATRENKPVASRPVRVGRVIIHRFLPDGIGDRCESHRGSRMAAVCGLHPVHGQGTNCVDRKVFNGRGRRGHLSAVPSSILQCISIGVFQSVPCGVPAFSAVKPRGGENLCGDMDDPPLES